MPLLLFVGCLGRQKVLADLASLYFVAITVGVAAFAGFRSFSFMLEVANVFPGERGTAKNDFFVGFQLLWRVLFCYLLRYI